MTLQRSHDVDLVPGDDARVIHLHCNEVTVPAFDVDVGGGSLAAAFLDLVVGGLWLDRTPGAQVGANGHHIYHIWYRNEEEK